MCIRDRAVVVQRESDLDNAKRRLVRSQTLSREGASSIQQLDDLSLIHISEPTRRTPLYSSAASDVYKRQVVVQRESDLDNAKRRLVRSQTLSREGASSIQQLDDDQAAVRNVEAALAATKAQVKAAQAGIAAAKSQVTGTRSTVTAAAATVTRIEADIADSQLKAPRDGRVQYRVAQPGEVLGGLSNTV